MVRIWFLTEGAREIASWRPGFTRQGDESRQDSKEDFGKVVLESWYYTRRVVQRYSRNSRHNSREFPTGCCWVPIPQKAAEEVLEAWNYTRRWFRGGPGGLVLHQGGWDRSGPRGGNWIPGNSRLCSVVQIPQNMATTGLIPMAARGVDTNGLRHLYQGSVGDSKRLECWCSRFTLGH